MSQSTEVIRKGDPYTNRLGHRVAADCDGLLIRFGCEVMLVPDVRLAGALNQLGSWRVAERRRENDR